MSKLREQSEQHAKYKESLITSVTLALIMTFAGTALEDSFGSEVLWRGWGLHGAIIASTLVFAKVLSDARRDSYELGSNHRYQGLHG